MKKLPSTTAGIRSAFSIKAIVACVAVAIAAPVIAGSVAYTYDSLGRLKTATYSNGVVITYNYDAAGNRTSQVTTGVP